MQVTGIPNVLEMCVDVCRQLTYVKEYCEGKPRGEGVSALTSEERTRWANVMERPCDCSLLKTGLLCQGGAAGTFRNGFSFYRGTHRKINPLSAFVALQARDYLISIDPHNETILETIQSSLFTVCLDETKPYSTPENYTNVRTLNCQVLCLSVCLSVCLSIFS